MYEATGYPAQLGQWTPPIVPAGMGSGDDSAWWEEPLGDLASSASEWLQGQLGDEYPSTSPYGPGLPAPDWSYPPELEQPPAAPAPAAPAPAAPWQTNAVTALALTGAGLLALRAAGAI